MSEIDIADLRRRGTTPPIAQTADAVRFVGDFIDALEVLDRRTELAYDFARKALSIAEPQSETPACSDPECPDAPLHSPEPAPALTAIEVACRIVRPVYHDRMRQHPCAEHLTDADMLAWLAERHRSAWALRPNTVNDGWVVRAHYTLPEHDEPTLRDALAWLVCERGGQP